MDRLDVAGLDPAAGYMPTKPKPEYLSQGKMYFLTNAEGTAFYAKGDENTGDSPDYVTTELSEAAFWTSLIKIKQDLRQYKTYTKPRDWGPYPDQAKELVAFFKDGAEARVLVFRTRKPRPKKKKGAK